MGYEDAKSTKVLAVHCCACGRPLRDAVSVELGIGPTCRTRLGFDTPVDESLRSEANTLVHDLAARGLDPAKIERLREIGFNVLADRLEARLDIAVEISEDGAGYLAVRTPFAADACETWRRIPGRRWDCYRGINRVPVASARALLDLLRAHYSGLVASGRRGLFVIA